MIIGELELTKPVLDERVESLIDYVKEVDRHMMGLGTGRADYGSVWTEEHHVSPEPYKSDDFRLKLLGPLIGKPLIDLCCGSGTRPFFRQMEKLGVSTYLGIDRDTGVLPGLPLRSIDGYEVAVLDPQIDKIKGAFVEGDVLEVLNGVKGNANFAINGVDALIMGTQLSTNRRDYWQEVVSQIDRIVPVGGYVIGHSDLGGPLEDVADLPNFETTQTDINGAMVDNDGVFFSIEKIA